MKRAIALALITTLVMHTTKAAAHHIGFMDRAVAGDVGAQIAAGDIEFEWENYSSAMHWYLLAAEHGNPIAQASIGALYRSGLGVRQNCLEARKWFLRAAAQGNFPAVQFLETEGFFCKFRTFIGRISEGASRTFSGDAPSK